MPSAPEPVPPTLAAVRRPWGLALLLDTAGLCVLGIEGYGLLSRPPAGPDHSTTRVGQPLPDFTCPDLHGNLVQPSALQARWCSSIHIWATWCPPCVEAMRTI